MIEIIVVLLISASLLFIIILISLLLTRNKKIEKELSHNVGRSLLQFLTAANTEYLKTLETNKIEYFSRFCTRGLCDRLSSLLCGSQDIQLYSQRAYSVCEWRICESTDNLITVEKLVRFRDIRVNGARVKLSEDVKEVWYLEKSLNKYLISSII